MAHMNTGEIDNLIRWNFYPGLGQALIDYADLGSSVVLDTIANKLLDHVEQENNWRDEADALTPVIELVRDQARTQIIASIRRARTSRNDKCNVNHWGSHPRAAFVVNGTPSCLRCLPSIVGQTGNMREGVEAIVGKIDDHVWARTNTFSRGLTSAEVKEVAKNAPLEPK